MVDRLDGVDVESCRCGSIKGRLWGEVTLGSAATMPKTLGAEVCWGQGAMSRAREFEPLRNEVTWKGLRLVIESKFVV